MRVYNGSALLVRHCWSWPRLYRGFQTSARHHSSTHYDVLGIKTTATQKEVKSAYIQSSKKYHPDVCSDPNAQRQFTKIVEAYEVLGSPESRLSYDSSFISTSYTTTGARGHHRKSTWADFQMEENRHDNRSGVRKKDLFDVRKGIKMKKLHEEEEFDFAIRSYMSIMDIIVFIMLMVFITNAYRKRREKRMNFLLPPRTSEDTVEIETKNASKASLD
ncbi:dnaJ homolog subfamily B member 9-like isoform X2 [Mizuhopecten yessoensis]|uniref:dnaJ homolog subfamily B member 9-like isoform X2 n=1 Tax=Mizuhopecten yessoensis TaxID=6573 RepID=UPI000B45DA59|nr:dnaJ homolog subfamily B member 9-like isoform X2 [Mizuhopecten yessoensis]